MDPVTMAMVGGGSLLSGLGGFMNAGNLAQANSQASQQSAMLQAIAMQQAQERFSQAQAALQPFMQTGSQSLNLLMKYLQGGAEKIGGGGSTLISNFAPTIEQLEKTPGYQFIKDQGTKAAQNAAAAKGLGSSGNALQSGVDYAEKLAGTTWGQQLDSYLKQNMQAYNMLFSPGQLGAQAAGQNMAGVANFNNSMLGAATGVGNTLAGGTMGAANAQANGINSLFGGMGNALMMGGMYGMNPYGVQSATNFGTQGPAFRNVYGGAGPGFAVPTV